MKKLLVLFVFSFPLFTLCNAQLDLGFKIKEITCMKGGNLGSATVIPSGGVSPYTYAWSPGSCTNQTYTGMSAGTYTVTVKDSTGLETKTATVIISEVSVYIDRVTSANCDGDSSGSMTAEIAWGSGPYRFAWSNREVGPDAQGLSAGTYTVMVIDSCSDTSFAYARVPGAVAQLTVIALNADSTAFFISKPDTALDYSWELDDFGTSYTGTGDTAFLPVYPRYGTLTYTATDRISSCLAQNIIGIVHPIDTTYHPPSNLPYPRWSKRGVWLESAPHYYTPFGTGGNIGAADSFAVNGTPFVTWCRNNHITYVILDGVDNDDPNNSCGVFSIDNSDYDTTKAVYLENFIDSLKTRGGVKEIGIECWPADISGNPDSNSYSVKVFNCANIAGGISNHNFGLPWEKKCDILNLDEEFWGYDSLDLSGSLNDFHTTHIPMLKAMYAAAHECGDNNLRVEDYIEEPTNPNNIAHFYINDSIDVMEADSISLYSDRILNSVYSPYPIALWNEADFRLAYPNFGNNPHKNMEIWPVFGAENYNMGSCPKFWYQSGNNFSGSNLCTLHKIDTADWIEEQYYDSLCFSEKYKVFTSTISNPDTMGADTNFQILGNMWYDYRAIDTERIQFDTLTSGIHKGYLQYYVTLPHDTQLLYEPHWPWHPITLKATVHGGTPPYNYIWRDMDSNKILQSSSSDSIQVTFSPAYPDKISVVAVDSTNSTAIDYTSIYVICYQKYKPHSPVKPTQKKIAPTDLTNGVKVYPNPANSQLNIEVQSTMDETCYFDLYDMMGQEVKKEALTGDNNVVNIISLSNGVYFYRVTKSDGSLINSGKEIIIH